MQFASSRSPSQREPQAHIVTSRFIEQASHARRDRESRKAQQRLRLGIVGSLQAGYAHATYCGKLFGPAINCLPTYAEENGELIRSDWLNSTCVFYRTEIFRREKFPEFEGYSFLEDVHVSARIGRTHELFFHRTATFEHRDAPSTFKRNARQLARMRVRHQRLVARDIVGLREPALTCKLFLHRLFASVSMLRSLHPSWKQELLGTWT